MPNADGHQCIADAIWEADTIDPGTTPLKWKLGYGEAVHDGLLRLTTATDELPTTGGLTCAR